jgi:hypothetical protein
VESTDVNGELWIQGVHAVQELGGELWTEDGTHLDGEPYGGSNVSGIGESCTVPGTDPAASSTVADKGRELFEVQRVALASAQNLAANRGAHRQKTPGMDQAALAWLRRRVWVVDSSQSGALRTGVENEPAAAGRAGIRFTCRSRQPNGRLRSRSRWVVVRATTPIRAPSASRRPAAQPVDPQFRVLAFTEACGKTCRTNPVIPPVLLGALSGNVEARSLAGPPFRGVRMRRRRKISAAGEICPKWICVKPTPTTSSSAFDRKPLGD